MIKYNNNTLDNQGLRTEPLTLNEKSFLRDSSLSGKLRMYKQS